MSLQSRQQLVDTVVRGKSLKARVLGLHISMNHLQARLTISIAYLASPAQTPNLEHCAALGHVEIQLWTTTLSTNAGVQHSIRRSIVVARREQYRCGPFRPLPILATRCEDQPCRIGGSSRESVGSLAFERFSISIANLCERKDC